MYGVSIDDRPNAPVGTPATRRSIAIHWEWTTEYSREEISDALGVQKSTIDRYIREGPTDDVQEQMDGVEAEIRLVAVKELKEQLKAAGSRSKTAEKPVEIYENDHGEVEVNDVEVDSGEVKKIPKVQDIQLLPDEQARYYARAEVREIIEQLADLVGAGEPDEVDVTHTGSLDLSVEDKEQLATMMDREVQPDE